MSDSVFVLHTGGTIGMVDSAEGAAPVAGALAPFLDWIVDNSAGELPAIEFLELDPPIDSANATPEDWCAIARVLHERRDDHAGFVVLHGTDTMAYTSSALSFLLPSFGKPVVVTGSQIPISRTRSDGRQNFIGALQVAARPDLKEVSLLFGEVVLRGNRATKIDASGLDAFDSPRLPPLADIGIDIVVNPTVRPVGGGEPRLVAGPLGKVAAMRLFPGFSASILANLCRPPLQGLVLEAYGAGNGPANDRDFLAGDRGRCRRRHRRGRRHPVRARFGDARCLRHRVSPAARRRRARLRHDERSGPDQAGRAARRGPRPHHGRRDDAA